MRLVLALLALILATRAGAETVVIRSGEHPGFSRLVLPLAAPSPWRFGRIPGGYGLRLARPAVQFDVSGVFRLIPRLRLSALNAPGGGRLDLQVTPGNYAELAEYNPRYLVIDIRGGRPPANSPFERPLDPAEGQGAAAMPVYNWRDNTPALPAATPKPAGATPAAAANTPPAIRLPRPVIAGLPEADAAAAPAPVATAHVPAPTAHAAAKQEAHPPPGQAPAAAPVDETMLHLGGAREALIQEIGRAATEGLLQVKPGSLPKPGRPEAAAPNSAPAPPHPAPALEPAQVPEGPRITMKTALDPRLAPKSGPELTPSGASCLPDRMFDLSKWSSKGSVSAQIDKYRSRLVGEFDRPDIAAVAGLMKLYIYLGFGAEARGLPDAMGVKVPDQDVLNAMAEIMDHGRAEDPGRLAGQAGCNGRVALWSVLARPAITAGEEVAVPAVASSFSALPLHLRRLLGPVLSGRFLDHGDIEAAHAIRDAVTRAAGPAGEAVTVMNARLDLAQGKHAEGDATLRAAAASGDSATAAEAEVLLVDAALAHDAGIEPADLERLATSLHAYRGSAMGRRLARAHLLAQALTGAYGAAFAELARLKSDPQVQDTGAAALWSLLAKRGDDEALLRHALDPAAAPKLPRPVTVAIARRLLSLGFPAPALAWLQASGPPDGDARLLAAEADLALGAPASVLAALGDATGPQAERLRAAALAEGGDHAAAASAYAAAGAPAREASQAWQAGNWAAARVAGTPAQKAALALALPQVAGEGHGGTAAGPAGDAGAAPATSSPVPKPAGELARGEALLAGSKALRKALDALLLSEHVPPAAVGTGTTGTQAAAGGRP